MRVEQGFDPQPVASQEEDLSVSVPEREREHAAQMLDASLAVILVQMHQDFGIAFCLKPVPLRDERIPQFLEIVDLSVHHHTHRSGLVPDRLAPPSHITNPPTGPNPTLTHPPPPPPTPPPPKKTNLIPTHDKLPPPKTPQHQ